MRCDCLCCVMSRDAMRCHVMCAHVLSYHLLCPAMGWKELYILCSTQQLTFTFHICQTEPGRCVPGCPEALAWDDANIYTCFWCIWCVWSVSGHSANDWGYWEKRCCSRPGSSMQMLFVFSSALLVALPQHACRY